VPFFDDTVLVLCNWPRFPGLMEVSACPQRDLLGLQLEVSIVSSDEALKEYIVRLEIGPGPTHVQHIYSEFQFLYSVVLLC